jgi:hypothetical protein
MSTFKSYYLIVIFSFIFQGLSAQTIYPNEVDISHPFGKAHPEAPQQIKDFAPLIGECDCKSLARKQDQTWQEKPTEMIWRFKYIMDGKAVQDETLKADGIHSGSIRQFNKDSLRWYVHYYSSNIAVPQLPVWEGNKKEDGKIILYRAQKSPSGLAGFYKISFYDISEEGFKWLGEWVNEKETVAFPIWKIDCKKRKI